MKRDTGKENGEVGMELKYCEHCGGLWVRESGGGRVFCAGCEAKVADLPAPSKRGGRLILPVGPKPKVSDYSAELGVEDSTDLEAVGGAA